MTGFLIYFFKLFPHNQTEPLVSTGMKNTISYSLYTLLLLPEVHFYSFSLLLSTPSAFIIDIITFRKLSLSHLQ